MTVPAVTGATAASTPSGSDLEKLAGLDSEAFMQLLMTQMRFQDPMEPMDQSQMLQQSAQLMQVQTFEQLKASTDEMLRMQTRTLGSQLVGRSATYFDGSSDVTGIVESVRFEESRAFALIGGEEVAVSELTTISA